MEQHPQKNCKGQNREKEAGARQKPRTKPEKQWGMTPKEGADDDNPAM